MYIYKIWYVPPVGWGDKIFEIPWPPLQGGGVLFWGKKCENNVILKKIFFSWTWFKQSVN